MDSFVRNVRALMGDRELTQKDFGDSIGVSLTTVNGWLKRGVQPQRYNIDEICRVYGVSHDDLLGNSDGYYARTRNLSDAPAGAFAPSGARLAHAPLLGRVHAGDAAEPDVLDDAVPIPYEVLQNHPRGYFLEVEGSCMDRVYPEGCLVLVDPDRTPQNGSIAVVSIDGGDYVMRRLYRGSSALLLVADSFGDWEDIVVAGEHQARTYGTVVWFQPRGELE